AHAALPLTEEPIHVQRLPPILHCTQRPASPSRHILIGYDAKARRPILDSTGGYAAAVFRRAGAICSSPREKRRRQGNSAQALGALLNPFFEGRTILEPSRSRRRRDSHSWQGALCRLVPIWWPSPSGWAARGRSTTSATPGPGARCRSCRAAPAGCST